MVTVTVNINGESRSWTEIDPSWINQQINRRRAEGQTVCVRVVIQAEFVDIGLRTIATCPSAIGGGGRSLTAREMEIVDLWEKRGLNKSDFAGGNLIAFLEQLESLLAVRRAVA